MSDFLAKVTAQLDTRAAEGQMTSFLKDRTMKVKVDLDTGNVNINNFLNQIKAQFQSAGQSAGQNMVNAINSSLGSINTKNSEYTLKNLQRTLAAFKFDRSQINTITQSLDSMDLAVQKVETRIREGGQLNLKVTGIDELGRSVTVLKEFDQASGTLRNVGKNISQSFSEVSNAGKAMFNDLDVSKLNASMSALDANFVKLKGSINAESTELQRLKQELANISQIQGLDNQKAAFERITLRVNQLSASYKTAKAEAASAAAAQQLMTGKTVLGNQIVTWMNRNTKAAKIYSDELKTLQSQLQAVSNGSQLKNVAQGFREIQTTAAAAGNLGKSVFGQLIGNMTKLSPLFGMGTAITTSIRTVKNMVSTVYELDTALVDLKKTTTMSDADLESFYNGANDVAKQMGVTTAEIINQASAWSRLGYSSKDAAESMAKLSSQFAAISPGMDVDSATDGLVSVMKAYGIEVDDVLDGIMSKINIIGNTAATSNAGIVEMLTRSSSAMSEANNSLEETIALETAAVEITQDAASVGTAYKTVAMRIRGYDEETQSYTNNIEELSGKIADLTKTASTPGGISLFTDDTKTEFKSTYQLLEEISNIYDQLTDKDQAALLEALAGKRQGQIVAATLKNFDAAREAMDNMAKSAGSADREMGVIQESLEYKINALKETGTGIAQNLFKKDDMKAVVDFGTGVLGVIEAITDKLGLFGTIGATAGITALIKNFSALKTLFSDLGSGEMLKAFEAVKNIQNWANGATGLLNPSVVQQYTAALEGMSLQQVRLVLSTQNLTAAQQAQILNALGLVASEDAISAALASEAMAQAGLSNETRALVMVKAGLTTATSTCTAAELEQALATQGIVGADAEAIMAAMGLSTANSTAAFSFTALTASIGAATKAIIAFLTTNPVGWAILAGTAIVGVATAFKKYNQAVEEARQVAQTAAGTFQDSTKSVDDYATKIQELGDKLSSGTLTDAEAYEAKKELLSIQNELKESYGEQAAGIDLLNGKLDEQISKVRALSKEEANEYLNKNLDAIQKAEKELNKTLGGDGNFMLEAGKVLGMFNDDLSDEAEKIKEIAAKYKDNIQLDDMGNGQIRVRFVGDAEDATTVLNDFMTDIRNAEGEIENTAFMDSLFDGAGDVVNEADEIIEKYKDIYDAAQKARLIADEKDYNYGGKSESAAKWLSDYAEAVQKYNDALLSGDTTKISQAKNEFQAIDTAVQALLKQDGFSEYAGMFEEIRSQLDETSAAHKEFENELSGTNLDDNSKSLKDYVNTLKSVEGGLTDINFADRFLEGLGEDEVSQAIQAIIDAYADLGLISTEPTQEEIEGLADTLVKAGVLTHDASTDVVNDVKEFTGAFEDFQTVLNDTEEGGFSKSLDTYTEKLDTLKESLEKFNEGDLTESDITTLIRQFPQLINYADDMGTGIQSLIDEIINVGDSSTGAGSLVDFFADAIANLGGESTEAGAAIAALRDQIIGFYNAANGSGVKINIDTETSKFSNMYAAAKNSRSATGLTNEDISNIKSMYSGLSSYDPSSLFERTENGIHLNTKALRELEAEYEQVNKNEISSKLRELRTQLESLGDAESDEKSKIQAQIENLEVLQSQYEGLTSTYNKWIQAQAAGNERDMYETIGSGKDTIQDLIDRGWYGSEEVRDYVDLISGKDLSTAGIDEILLAWKEVNSTIAGTDFTAFDFFTTDKNGKSTTDGIYNFFDAVNQTLGDGYAKIEDVINDNGEVIGQAYSFDFSNGKGAEVAERLGLDAEYIQSILRAAIDAGFDVDLNSAWERDLDSVVETVQDKRQELEKLGTEPIEINLDVEASANGDISEIENEISKVTAAIDEINQKEIKTKADTANLEYYKEALNVLIQKKIEATKPAYMTIDVSSATTSMAECLQALQNYKQAENELSALTLNPTADTSQIEAAQQKVESAAQAIQKLPAEVKTKIGINGEDSVDTIIDKMKSLDPDTEIFLTVDTKDSISSTEELKDVIDKFEDKDVKITVSIEGDGIEAVEKLKETIEDLQDEKPVTVSPTIGGDGLEGITELNDAIVNLPEREVKETATVKGKPDVDALKKSIDSLYPRTIQERANVYGTSDVQALKKAIDSLYSKTVFERANVYGTSDVMALKKAIDSLYSRTVTTTHVTNNITNNTTNNKVIKVANGTATPLADGSAFANGSTSHKTGDWGLKDSGIGFGGEVGQELVVRDGKFFTIGDNSAEFFQYKKGDIIFNAEQTKQIFEKGKILYGKKRGKAFVTGSAFADASTGAGVRYSKTATTGYWTPVSSSNYTPSSSYTRTENTANITSGETAFDKFKNWLDKLFDWTEIKLERQTRKIEKYTSRADAALEAGSYSNAAINYRKAILSSSTQITNNENAAKKYKETADQVLSNAIGQGLISKDKAANIAKAVANGSINISSYSEEVQKVVQSYQEWYEKSLSCADAVETLHQNIRKYVQSLKDVRDTQRDTTLETIDLYSTIGTSGYTNTSSGYYGLKNSQLIYANKQLNSQNAAYATEVNNVTADANNLGKTANTAISSQLKTNEGKKNNSAYNKALKNAQSAIKANKPISSSDLSTIKNYSTSTYEQLYAYNLQLSNVETAKLEQATAYAANSSDIYSNIAETYNNKDTANSNKLDLYKQQAENATDAKSANESLLNAIQRYNTILDDDQAEISQYTTDVKTKQSIIKKDNTSHRGLNYSSLSQSAKANVDKYIDSVQSSVASRKAISADILAQLAKYYSKGYITLAFYQACIDYNNALEYRRQANIQYALDQETVKAEKAAIGTQMLENVMQEYTNKVNTNSTKTTTIQTAQSLKTAKGISLSKSDYNDLINQSKIDQQIYADEVFAIDNQIKLNLTNGVWTTSSQEYKDALITLEEYKDKVNQCVVQQEEWNNSIVNMELEKYEKLLDLLDAISSYNDSLVNLAKAEGKVVTATNIQQQISDRYEQVDTLQQERNVAYQNYQKALSNSDNVYGGKTADEWKSQYMQLGTSINQVKIEITNLYDDLNSIELNKLISQLDQLSDASNRLQDALNIKEAKGIKATIQDYQELIANSNERVLNLQKENVELSTQLQSYEKGSDKYNECLKQINSNDSSIREATKSQIEWNNAIIELPIEKLENLLDVLESIAKYNKSVTELKIASGQVVNYVDYQKQIADINDQISVLEEKRSILFRNYQEALLDSNGVYGGKTADEWKKQFNELGAKINNSKADIEELKDKINEIKLDRLSADLSSLADAQDKLKDSISLKKERGQYATESDYNALISNSKQQVLNLQAQNAELQKQQSLTEKYSEKYEELQRNIEDNEQSIRDAAIAQEEWNNAIINLPYERIEKILNKLDTIADYNKSLSDLKAAKGEDLSLEDYTQQISDNNATIAQLEEKRTNAYSDYLSALTNSDGVYGGKTADEWLSEFKKFGTEINNLYADNESIKDSLRDDVYWRTYERAHDACEQYANVLSGLTELIDESMYFDSDGYLTDFGISKIAILVGEYENAREEAQNYSNDIKNLNSLYTQGYYTQTEYFEKLSELQSGLLESASDMKSTMSEITDMYKQSAQYELDNLFKIIDARNDALAAKKEYYDYDKTISSKTKDIQSLQAQIAALDGIETAEAKSKRATLQAELSNAQDDLNDTINNHMFELSQNSLNDMKDALQDAFDDKWEDISGSLSEISNLMASANDLIYTSTATINSTFNKLLNYYGMSSLSVGTEGGTSYTSGMDNNIQNVWTDSLNSLMSDTSTYREAYQDYVVNPADYLGNAISSVEYKLSNGQKVDQKNIINQYYDSLLNVEGNVDSTVISDMQKFSQSFYRGAYEYTVKEITKDARKIGIKV